MFVLPVGHSEPSSEIPKVCAEIFGNPQGSPLLSHKDDFVGLDRAEAWVIGLVVTVSIRSTMDPLADSLELHRCYKGLRLHLITHAHRPRLFVARCLRSRMRYQFQMFSRRTRAYRKSRHSIHDSHIQSDRYR